VEYRSFPATGDRLSVLGFGAMGFAGWFGAVDDGDGIRALHTAMDLGVNVIDTARAYGRSEAVVGKALAVWSGPRPFVATKVEPVGPQSQFATPPRVEEAFPKGWVTQSCETSLRGLGLDAVDLMQLHLYWPTWGHEGYWMDELQSLKESGKARSVGISIPDHRHDSAISLVESGLIDSVQTILHVFASEPLDTLIPICQRNNVAVIARCILDEGGLTGSLTEDSEFPPGDFRHGYFDWTVPRRAYLAKVAALDPYIPEHASSMAALAVKFAIRHPGVTTAITSMHVEEYARMNVAAVAEEPLSDELMWTLQTSHRFEINLSNRDAWPVAAAEEVAAIGTAATAPQSEPSEPVRWVELKPAEFLRRLAERPVAYLPMGMCEPHGHGAAFGLDMIKADYICDQAAHRFGGIVVPSQGYHIHETGFHGTWLEEVVGDVNPRLGALPPDVVMRSLLFQLRALVNAGFRAVMVVSGQNGAQGDLRLVADEFMKLVPVPVIVRSDPELVRGTFSGDHAGRYELSQLLYIRPDLIDLTRLDRVSSDPLGRFAQNPDAHQASAQYGEQIIETTIARVGQLVDEAGVGAADIPQLSFDDVEPAWAAVERQRSSWVSYGSVSG
jgi:methylglyoxal reductase